MKQFSKLYSDFWINHDNVEIVSLGIDAQLMALYLQSNPHCNMFGIYYLPLLYISSDLRLSVERVQTALTRLCEVDYCRYDEKTRYVWVCNLASEQIGKNISNEDNRIKAIHAIWDSLPLQLEFLENIYQKYGAALHFKPRVFEKPSKICKTERLWSEVAVKNVSSSINTNKDINVSVSSDINTATEAQNFVESSSDSIISTPFEVSPEVFSESFEEVYQDINIDKGNAVFESNYEKDSLTMLSEPPETFLEAPLGTKTSSANNYIVSQTSLEDEPIERNERSSDALSSLKPLRTTFEGGYEGPSEPLVSPFKGASDPLRSNIECRIKNIENRSKKEEVEERRKDIYKSSVLTPSIVAQAQLCVDEEPPDKNFISFEKTKEAVCLDSAPKTELVSKGELEPKQKSKKERAENSVDGSVATVFEYWKSKMEHPRSKLDRKRKVLIQKALQLGYSAQQLCDAITGCSYTPHNIGQNDRGQRYDGLHVILRDADQIDRFIYNCQHPPKPFTKAYQRLHANLDVANNWVQNKLSESVGNGGGNYV